MKKKVGAILLAAIMVLSIGATTFASSGTWMHDDGGWWYAYEDGSYAANKWEYMDGDWYHFNGSGYMDTGWIWDGAWYYMNPDGTMAAGWVWDGAWYYMNPNGTMAAGWIYDGAWYYMKQDGTMATGWVWDGAWYFMRQDGTMATGWVWDGAWYYMNPDGTMATGWLLQDTDWYYLKEDGTMAAETLVIDGMTYYFADNGVWIPDSNRYKSAYRSILLANEKASRLLESVKSGTHPTLGNVIFADVIGDDTPEMIYSSLVFESGTAAMTMHRNIDYTRKTVMHLVTYDSETEQAYDVLDFDAIAISTQGEYTNFGLVFTGFYTLDGYKYVYRSGTSNISGTVGYVEEYQYDQTSKRLTETYDVTFGAIDKLHPTPESIEYAPARQVASGRRPSQGKSLGGVKMIFDAFGQTDYAGVSYDYALSFLEY